MQVPLLVIGCCPVPGRRRPARTNAFQARFALCLKADVIAIELFAKDFDHFKINDHPGMRLACLGGALVGKFAVQFFFKKGLFGRDIRQKIILRLIKDPPFHIQKIAKAGHNTGDLVMILWHRQIASRVCVKYGHLGLALVHGRNQGVIHVAGGRNDLGGGRIGLLCDNHL